MDHEFRKEYLAVVHGRPVPAAGSFSDLLLRSKEERKTYVTDRMEKGVQEAVLDYETVSSADDMVYRLVCSFFLLYNI